MYNLKIIYSGDRVEIYKVNNYVIRDDFKREEESEELGNGDDTDKGKQSYKDRQKTLREAKNNIIRLIKSNPDMTTFITLTFAIESDFIESKKYLNNLFNKLRRDYSNLKYIWVLEYGEKNGRLHYHLLCNIPINIKLSTSKEKKSEDHKTLEQSFQQKYWKYGIVDIRSLSQEDNTNVALYVATYITKSMQVKELEGYRVFGYSHKTLLKPIEVKLKVRSSTEEVLKSFAEDYKVTYSNSYEIGYVDWKGEHSGNVSYFDLVRSD